MERVEVVVVGAGIMGAASAWALARRGRSVTLLDQFEPGHVQGSSHGGSRIFRLAYPDVDSIDLARAAGSRWRELEAASGTELLTRTGSVDHGDPRGLAPIEAALTAAGVPFDRLDPLEAELRWPGMRFDGTALHQPAGGRVLADRALVALVAQVEALGGTTRWNTAVHAVEPNGDRVRVVTDAATYDAAVAVVAAGGWVAPLLAATGIALPDLVVTQESAFHFAARDSTQWPSFIHHGSTAIYGLETPGEGVKVAEHHAGPIVTAATRDFEVDAGSRDRVSEFVDAWLPGLEPSPVTEVTCLYTNTADEEFILDRVGPVVVVSPCSGHGFKFAPAIGELAADLVDGRVPVPRFTLPDPRGAPG